MDELTAVDRFLLEVLHDPKRRESLLEICYKEGFREDDQEADRNKEADK